jgi:hypothetical protein
VEAQRAFEQRGAKAELHHDEQHRERDAGDGHHQAHRLVAQLLPAERHART